MPLLLLFYLLSFCWQRLTDHGSNIYLLTRLYKPDWLSSWLIDWLIDWLLWRSEVGLLAFTLPSDLLEKNTRESCFAV